MNKLLILACAAALAVGVGAAFLLQGHLSGLLASVPNTLQLPEIQLPEYIRAIPEYIRGGASTLWEKVQPVIQNPLTIVGAIGGLGSFAVTSVTAWKNVKKSKEELEQLMQTKDTETTAKLADLEGQLEAKNIQLAGVTDLQANYDAAVKDLATMTTARDKAQALYADASNQIGKVVSPSNPEMIRRLEQDGYRVVKIVA